MYFCVGFCQQNLQLFQKWSDAHINEYLSSCGKGQVRLYFYSQIFLKRETYLLSPLFSITYMIFSPRFPNID